MPVFDKKEAATPNAPAASGDNAPAGPPSNAGGATKLPTLYPARFVFADDNKPLKAAWIYTDVPGDDKFKLENRWQTTETGQAGKVLENTEYNFHWDAEKREKDWLEERLTEAHCNRVTTGSVKEGLIEVKIARPKFELEVNGSTKPEAHYLGWAPSKCTLKQTAEGTPALDVLLRCKASNTGGKLSFYEALDKPATDTLDLKVKAGAQTVEFHMGGKFGFPSQVTSADTPSEADREKDKDTVLEVVCNGTVVLELPLFIRVRKNANTLTPFERDRFLNALGALKQGTNFKKIEQMHNDMVQGLIHGGPSFLPWHRAYLLDLEREVQNVDPTVCLHYWHFDQESWDGSRDKVALFTESFIGKTAKNGGTWEVTFASSNPLSSAKHDWGPISRMPTWDPSGTIKGGRRTSPGWDHSDWGGGDPLNSESAVIGLGSMMPIEGNPHNPAHANLAGDLGGVNTAPHDPLFFMLHSNVDRLWAAWQEKGKKWDVASNSTFSSGTSGSGTAWSKIDGHRLGDTPWPWDGKTGPGKGRYDRPTSAPPGAGMPESKVTKAPAKRTFTLGDMLDYQGRSKPENRLGMDHDTVGF